MEVIENPTDSDSITKESPLTEDGDEGIDLNNSSIDKVSDPGLKETSDEALENVESEKDSEIKANSMNDLKQESIGKSAESDSDDDEMFRKKPLKKKKAIVSDDEDSDDPMSQLSMKSKMGSESSKKSALESSDSDDSDNEQHSMKETKKKKMRIINSDDSDDELDSLKDTKKKNKRAINSDSEEDSDMEMFKKTGESQSQESTPSYNQNVFDHFDSDDDQDEMGTPSNKKKSKEPTHKDRERERLEIASESQRMQREATFSLPYHKPKQRSLAEFLNRRKTVAPIANTMKGSLKMSMRNPEILKRLESRKAQVEEFYASDDEGAEDPEDAEWKPGMEPKRTDSDKDSDDEEMEVEEDKAVVENKVELRADKSDVENKVDSEADKSAVENKVDSETDKSVLENKVDSAPSEPKDDDGLSLNAGEKVEQSSDDIVSSESKDEKDKNTPKSLMDDELPDIGNTATKNEECNESANEINQLGMSEESKSNLEQMDVSEDKIPNNTAKDTQNVDVSCLVTSKTLQQVNDSGIQSGASSSNEDHDSNDSTKTTVKAIEKGDAAELNTQMDETVVVSVQGTPSLQNKNDNSGENNTPKLALLASKIPTLDLKTTPKLGLGASSGDFIDLEEDTTPKDKAGLNSFLDRFIKHSKTKRAKAGKRQVNLGVVQKVTAVDGQENLESSSICVELEEDEDHTITEEVPGAKRLTLKQALVAKMREQREQERLKRLKQKRFMDEEDVEGEEEILDDEGDFTDKSESEYETESEPEENDVVIKDKKRKKSKFLDEEADEDEDQNDGEEDENDPATGVMDEDDDSNDTVVLGSRAKKKPTINEDDSDTNCEEDLHLEWENTQDVNKDGSLHRTETQDMFASQSNDKPPKKMDSADKDSSMTSMDSSFEFFGSVIPAHQPGGGMKNPRLHLNSESQDTASNTGFLTPLLKQHKTDSFGSVSKGCDLSLPFENSQELCSTPGNMSANRAGSPSPVGASTLQLTPMENSQFVSGESSNSPGAKLRLDFVGATQTQQTGAADELVGLCSGQFNGKTQDDKGQNLYDDDDLPPTQNIDDLMGLCSGQFNTQAPKNENMEKSKERSGAFSELFDSRSKTAMEDDDLIGLCTGKFTTQKGDSESMADDDIVTQDKDDDSDGEDKPRKKMVIDSDDDDLVHKLGNKEKSKKKRKRKRIVAFGSDDEDDNAVDFVPDFDDEENPKEGLFSGFKDKSTGGIRKDFLDAEAELSGSEEEVSDDEDEEGEDFLEMEAGDAEKYDDDELRDQVGRAHMKAEMDADKRQLRLLQEMYLEDGELHGEGRQRSFRWRNNDENDDSNQNAAASDEEDHNEEETEDAEWRKLRFEREKFLQEQNEKVKDGENEPEIFKIGPPLVRTKSVKSTKREPLKPSNPPANNPTNATAPTATAANTKPIVPSNPFCMPTKRGSFLSRNKSTLAKIAELTKDKGSTVGGAKQGGNFVFQQLSAEEVEARQELSESKLNRSISAPAMKKARLDRSFFSLDETKQKTSIFKHL